MARWPDFLIVGAPRCATTSLWQYLRQHPDVFMPELKEPGFFQGDPGMAEADYLELFEDAAPDQVRGEATTGYLGDPAAPDRIADRIPDARIVASLRDPVERAHSNYLAFREKGYLETSFADAVEAELRGDGEWPFVRDGRYHTSLRRYLDRFGEDRVHVVLFDEIQDDARACVREVAAFLGVDPDVVDRLQTDVAHNVHGEPRNALAGWLLDSEAVQRAARTLLPLRVRMYLGNEVLQQPKSKPPIPPDVAERLREVYEPEIDALEDLLGRDLPDLRRTWETG